MEEKIEKIIELAGTNNRYQYILLLITLFIWINVDIIPISLPFLEKMPDISYTDSSGRTINSQLNYSLCESNKNYNITSSYAYSWVIEFNVYCDRLTTGLIGSICFLGSFISSFLFQYQATHLGRKRTVLLNLVLFAIILGIFYFSSSISMIMLLVFLVQLTPASVCLASYIHCCESVSKEKRSLFGAIVNSGFCICGIIYIFVFKYFQSWRLVFIISAVICVICAAIYKLFIKESPRYWISKGHVDKFIKNCREIAEVNGRKEEFDKKIKYNKDDSGGGYTCINKEVINADSDSVSDNKSINKSQSAKNLIQDKFKDCHSNLVSHINPNIKSNISSNSDSNFNSSDEDEYFNIVKELYAHCDTKNTKDKAEAPMSNFNSKAASNSNAIRRSDYTKDLIKGKNPSSITNLDADVKTKLLDKDIDNDYKESHTGAEADINDTAENTERNAYKETNESNDFNENENKDKSANRAKSKSQDDDEIICNENNYSGLDLIKYPSQRYLFLISCILWFCISGNYYGLTIHMKHLPGDIYLNGILIYTFEMISYFFSGFIINFSFIGRKGAIFTYYLIAVLGFLLLMIKNLSHEYYLSLFLITRFVVAGVFNILYTYTVEIYPTVLRAQGFAFNSAFGKIGSIIFPLLIEIFAQYVNLLFASMNIVCFCLMFFMPETLNKSLMNNIPEVEEKFEN
jgi:MFS family permease